jgi:hypothetical protein
MVELFFDLWSMDPDFLRARTGSGLNRLVTLPFLSFARDFFLKMLLDLTLSLAWEFLFLEDWAGLRFEKSRLITGVDY